MKKEFQFFFSFKHPKLLPKKKTQKECGDRG